jgi:hypothetical protein
MSTISASTLTTTALVYTADTTGALVFQTGATPTTALTLGADQSATFAGTVSFATASFTNLSYTGTLTGGTGVVNLGSGQFYKDASGAVGIGVTPSTWYSIGVYGNALQLGATSSLYNYSDTGNHQTHVLNNTYLNSTPNWVYQSSDYASRYLQQTGHHTFYTVGSGTAGATISWTTSADLYLNALSIGSALSSWNTASGIGNFQLGTVGGLWSRQSDQLLVLGANGFYNGSDYYATTGPASRMYLQSGTTVFNYAASGTAGNTISWLESMRIDNGGLVGIGTTPYYGHKLAVAGTTVVQNLYLNSVVGGYQTGLVNDGGNTSTAKSLTITNAGGTELQVNYWAGNAKFYSTIGVGNTAGSTSGAGITFPATQSASSDVNTLDDYEEGSWTPVIKFSGSSVGTTYSAQVGNYVKVGRWVTIAFNIALSAKGSSTGSVTIQGMPFVNYTNLQLSAGCLQGERNMSGFNFTNAYFLMWNDGQMYCRYNGATGYVDIQSTNFTDTSCIYGCITYETSN